MHLRLIKTCLAAALLSSLVFLMGADGGCGDPIIENNGFDLWCGDQLCFWDVEEGSIAKVPTWHKSDNGIELRGNAVAISQLTEINSGINCLRFRAVANIEETAEVTVEVDFFDDGVVDVSERIPTSDWAPITFLTSTPRYYRGARFRIKKLGSGTAQLAELVVEVADKCVDPPIELDDRPLGAVCSENSECTSGLCVGAVIDPPFPGTCGECESDDQCPSGQVCGLSEAPSPALQLYRSCQDPATDDLGERCASDLECASSICATAEGRIGNGVCSTCRSDDDCGGSSCEEIPVVDSDVFFPTQGPLMCAPYSGVYASGESCVLDQSCDSGTCEGPGELRVCSTDGRLCDDDGDCFRDGHCVAIGTSSGTCR